MIRAMKTVIAVALAALVCSASSAGAGTPQGHIVFAATNAPLNDDVMLVRANGTELDLSNSPAYDTAPAVSPDGKLVAFFSMRNGHGAEYVVGIDGKGVRQVTPALAVPPEIAWAPDGRDLAVLSGPVHGRVHRASAAGGVWVRLDHGDGPTQFVGWSPGGGGVAYLTSIDAVRVVDRRGRVLHTFSGDRAKWSPSGRLAVERDSRTWQVYDAAGTRLATIPAVAVAWSPTGRLASITPAGVVQVRPGGTGRPTVSARPFKGASDPLWADATHLLLRGDDGYLSYDVAHNATFLAPAAYRFGPSIVRGGSAYGEYPFGTLVRSTLSGSTRTLVKVPYCQGKDTDAFEYLQALPDGSGAVFAGDCFVPHDLYTVTPDGSGVKRLTSTSKDELDPAVSPDGTRLAYTLVDGADCVGCNHQIWISNLDGSAAHAVPLPSEKLGPILQDDRASFSPDGAKLVFTRWDSSVSDQATLYEVAARGGAATSLHVFGGDAAWAPARIAFVGPAGDETIAPNGTEAALVPGTPKLDSGIPAWSADGRLALLEWEKSFDIYLPASKKRIALPGLTASRISESWPGLAWSPDGTRLAFTAADRNGATDVWIVGADGTGLARVTHGLGADGALTWR